MVFRGRPSKACQRCRARRLKCDYRPDSCTPCLRAAVVCHGYRDPQAIRIVDQTEDARRKALLKWKPARLTEASLSVSIDVQARMVFFAHYVSEGSRGWDFLIRWERGTEMVPRWLDASIDAVSLALLAHHHVSAPLLTLARQRYALALRVMKQALSFPPTARDSLIAASLLLDLFEKITHTDASVIQFWPSHVNGTLALIQKIGVEHFQDHYSLRIMSRFLTNYIISCVASAHAVSNDVLILRDHLERHLNLKDDPKWKISGLTMRYASFLSAVQTGRWSLQDGMTRAQDLDQALLAISRDMPPEWQPDRRILRYPLPHVYGQEMDFYRDRHATQAWNVLRQVRIQLNEYLLDGYETLNAIHGGNQLAASEVALSNIAALSLEVYASVPQYASYACRPRCSQGQADGTDVSVVSQKSCNKVHTPSELLDCYTLLFPMYIAARSKAATVDQRQWVSSMFRYISDHFGIRNALLLAQLLDQNSDISPWCIYAMLGGYGFAA
ncbi:hypothetical protein IFM58399_08870 [Aspergillus lentulus]|uniref:Zn(2)-C6 fungal-type domain-containing protein n=1 Tax=Aspergillus lentulus TaxID=293939 RepID=A0ABQ1A9T7_ASPLE|nr:uncharacterized protein IFM58399_08870 [Aspergillus lentulus]GFF50674.1 hypothetical protein IFM58399_08870 [Aspergillus lentulus]GFF73461.1 hypothetical protein IFM62136_08580 [Aspergillus lentulus]GFF74691.1 hypothetical protein IFM60648_04255 [Aspergillus lentulus]GFF96177.1 hypothetical protein IFM47457_10745 [Aspergillus lentulus]